MLDINFNMQLVRTSRISGHVTNPDGTPVSSGNVNLMPTRAAARGGQIGMQLRRRASSGTASFTIGNVPPGRYMLRARGDDRHRRSSRSQPISVDGGDLPDVTVSLSPGATISGTVAFLPRRVRGARRHAVRITAPSTDQPAFGPQPNARVDKDGRFTLHGVCRRARI